MTEPLLQAGKWLKMYGEAIYDTRPFILAPEVEQDGLRLRFTRTNEHFYIIALSRPSHSWTIPALLPILEGDRITRLTSSGEAVAVPWIRDGPAKLTLQVGETQEHDLAWVFRVEYDEERRHPRDEL
jgi:alpha-L-fucosidase